MSIFGFKRTANIEEIAYQMASGFVSFTQEVSDGLNTVVALTRKNGHSIPVEASLIIFKMVDDINELNKHLESSAPSRDERIAVEFMVKDYLPSTINAYLISRSDEQKKNADFVEQLSILHAKVDSMLEAVYAHDSAQLEVNGQFLAQKFGRQ